MTKNKRTDRRRSRRMYRRTDSILFYTIITVVVILSAAVIYAFFIKGQREDITKILPNEALLKPYPSEIVPTTTDAQGAVRIGVTESEPQVTAVQGSLSPENEAKINRNFDFSTVQARAYAVYDVDTKTFLLSYNIDDSLAPASLTKVMTCFVGIEEEADINARVTMEPWIFDYIYGKDLSVAGYVKGETANFVDLLYACILPSGADACLGIAQAVSGSQEGFVELMNRRAQDLGMKHTHFMNCIGNDEESHRSTVRDLCRIMEVAMRNKIFAKVASTVRYQIPSNSTREEDLNLYSNSHELIAKYGGLNPGIQILGSKTGYTEDAGSCLLTMIRKSGHDYILCSMNSTSIGGASNDIIQFANSYLR